jgi:hypothetical protein
MAVFLGAARPRADEPVLVEDAHLLFWRDDGSYGFYFKSILSQRHKGTER